MEKSAPRKRTMSGRSLSKGHRRELGLVRLDLWLDPADSARLDQIAQTLGLSRKAAIARAIQFAAADLLTKKDDLPPLQRS